MDKKTIGVGNIIGTIIAICMIYMIGGGIYVATELNTFVNNKNIDENKDNEINLEQNEIQAEDLAEERSEEVVETNKLDYLNLEEDTNAEDAKVVESMLRNWNYLREDGKKIAYLTFDDGPSNHITTAILDVLKSNDVKATFFVLGSMVEKSDRSKAILKTMVEDGHAIGNHGYCHRYEILYPNRTANPTVFMEDMKKSENVMKSVLGQEFHTRVMRFPGGHSSWNTNALDTVLETEGYVYIDWNTLNGDAELQNLSPEKLINRLQETVTSLYGNDDVLVVLMHDTDEKQNTVKSLQGIIDYLKSLGYEFKTLK